MDSSAPEGGVVHTGTGSETDAPYSSDITTVTASWDSFKDSESGISQYQVTVRVKLAESDSFEDLYQETVDSRTSQITLTHFSFASNDSILVAVSAMNGAGGTTEVLSSPYLIDLSPPHVLYLIDGANPAQDLIYQSLTNQLTISWDASDSDSQIDSVQVSVWEMTEGRHRLIFPDPSISDQLTFELPDPSLKTYTIRDLNLAHGVKYITSLSLRNGAGLVSEHESSGVTVDLTTPLVTVTEVEGQLVMDQETGTVQLAVVGTSTLSVRWSAVDPESGVTEILVGVVDRNNSLISPLLTRFEGHSRGGILDGLNLTVGSEYRVAVTAVNGAETESETTYSQQFT